MLTSADLAALDVHDLIKMLVSAIETLKESFLPPNQEAFLATWLDVWSEVGRRISTDQELFYGFLNGAGPILEAASIKLANLRPSA